MWVTLGLGALSVGCSADTTGEVLVGDGRDARVTVDATAPVDAPAGFDVAPIDRPGGTVDSAAEDVSTAPDLPVTREAFCMGTGPSVLVGDTTTMGARCTGRLAETVFRHGLCTCTDLALAGYLHTDSWDSSRGTMMTAERGGAVGINGNYTLVGATNIGDALTIGGATPLRLIGAHTVRGDLETAGSIEVIGTLTVERNARVRGAISALGPARVNGDLTQPPGVSPPLFGLSVSGTRRTAPVDVPPPCACQPAEIIDVASIVREGQRSNHNAEAMFSATTFNNVVGRQVTELPCGRFYVERIFGLGSIELHVNGRSVLFVGGDLDMAGVFDIDLGPMGELDVFIGGSITGAGYLRLGRATRPSAVRFYIAGDRGFTLAGASGFVGNVYAPRAPVTIAGYMSLNGSLFAQRIATGGDLDVHYDRAVLHAGETCPDVPLPSGGCMGCGAGVCRSAQACVSGRCGMCRTDGDCCAPLLCETRTGECLPIPP